MRPVDEPENFARCSGVIVDVCRGTAPGSSGIAPRHHESSGRGLALSRQKEKREITFEREQLRHEQLWRALMRSRVFFF